MGDILLIGTGFCLTMPGEMSPDIGLEKTIRYFDELRSAPPERRR